MNVGQLMSRSIRTCHPGDSLNAAAQIMWEEGESKHESSGTHRLLVTAESIGDTVAVISQARREPRSRHEALTPAAL